LEGRGVKTAETSAPTVVEGLYREEGRRLWWAVVAYSGDEDVASDAVAEAFAQALGRGDSLGDPLAWIWRVAFRVAAGELKQRRMVDHRLPDVIDPSQQRANELVALLRQLPEKQRAAIVLHYYADRPVKDVAAALRVTPATARVHLHRARCRLLRLLEGHDE
jgi:RNA polymerase sigma-70 factor (ECF subfamily)